MKIQNLVYAAFTLVAILSGCGQSKQKRDLIQIDVTANFPEKEFLLQDVFDVEYVPLETRDSFLTMGHIQAVNDEFIVSRNKGRQDGDIYVFDRKTGKGVSTFNHLGQGNGEYMNVLEVIMDAPQRELYVNSHWIKKIFVYDIEGNYKRSFNHNGATFYHKYAVLDSFLVCDDIDWDHATDGGKALKDHYLAVSKEDGRIIKAAPIPYEEKISTVIFAPDKKDWRYAGRTGMSCCNGDVLLMETSSDTIYRFKQDLSLVPFSVRTPSIHQVDNLFLYPLFCSGKQYLFYVLVKKEHDFKTNEGFPTTNLVYDKKDGSVYKVSVYNADYTEETPLKIEGEVFVLRAFNQNGVAFTQTLYASDLVEAYQEGRLKGRLKEIASTLDEEDNPVILIAKYKQ